ncbi:MAG: 30S ribosomal protein S6 [Planctomycetota bacterium]|nr:MAG: 30S ribosomal protein S6 [Planctomycetota bacterium]
MKLYEAMFLVDSAEATADWEGINAVIKKILEKAGAEIVSIRKWDDRKLAYEINGKSRGTYILCYFRAEGEKIRGIERDVQLSEQIMRVLILSAEHMSQEDIEKDTPAIQADKRRQKGAAAVVKAKPE